MIWREKSKLNSQYLIFCFHSAYNIQHSNTTSEIPKWPWFRPSRLYGVHHLFTAIHRVAAGEDALDIGCCFVFQHQLAVLLSSLYFFTSFSYGTCPAALITISTSMVNVSRCLPANAIPTHQVHRVSFCCKRVVLLFRSSPSPFSAAQFVAR